MQSALLCLRSLVSKHAWVFGDGIHKPCFTAIVASTSHGAIAMLGDVLRIDALEVFAAACGSCFIPAVIVVGSTVRLAPGIVAASGLRDVSPKDSSIDSGEHLPEVVSFQPDILSDLGCRRGERGEVQFGKCGLGKVKVTRESEVECLQKERRQIPHSGQSVLDDGPGASEPTFGKDRSQRQRWEDGCEVESSVVAHWAALIQPGAPMSSQRVASWICTVVLQFNAFDG